MKASKEQLQRVELMLGNECNKLGLSINAICTINDCWVLLTRAMICIEHTRPIGYGTVRDWLFNSLDDSHIETVFRKILPKLR